MFSNIIDDVATIEPIWDEIISEAEAEIKSEPLLSDVIGKVVLRSDNLGDSISRILSIKLQTSVFHENLLHELFADYWSAYYQERIRNPRKDLIAIRKRDPACRSYLVALLHMKGFQALQAQRLMHWL